jgi:hypothetical protein
MTPRRLLFMHLNYPLYIPEPNRGILAVLEERGLSGMLSEVERLSALGSPWASATLGYLSLLPSSRGEKDPTRAIELCAKAAADGDPYALYVMGWARFILTEDRVKAAEAMLQSNRKRFTPATLAMAFFVWPNSEIAFRFIDTAQKLGHKAAWSFRCGFLKTGRVGVVRQIAGYVMAPFARLRYALAVWLNPFSENVLFLALADRRPVYRSMIGSER